MDFNGNQFNNYGSMGGGVYGGSDGSVYDMMNAQYSDGYSYENPTQSQSRGYGESRGFNPTSWTPEETRGGQVGAAALGGPGYRSPLRYTKLMRELNSRNGLHSPTDQRSNGLSRSGTGDGYVYNSLPGLDGGEGQMGQGHGGAYF